MNGEKTTVNLRISESQSHQFAAGSTLACRGIGPRKRSVGIMGKLRAFSGKAAVKDAMIDNCRR